MVSSAEQVANGMCICRGCPSYRFLGKEDEFVAYCYPTHGTSRNIKDEKGCFCGICRYYSMSRFMTQYYCTRGSENEQKEAIAKAVQTGQDVWKLLPGPH